MQKSNKFMFNDILAFLEKMLFLKPTEEIIPTAIPPMDAIKQASIIHWIHTSSGIFDYTYFEVPPIEDCNASGTVDSIYNYSSAIDDDGVPSESEKCLFF
ncbi:MAG: hypothetical protein KBD64_00520 [Gammaproteobacteria bacterium]|nr:hypothetical protein [Gammaproteobacteria bacterium]